MSEQPERLSKFMREQSREFGDDTGGERRWDSARTNRLNESRWVRAHDQSINLDLDSWLSTLRMRSAYEAANNPILAGMIETHVMDIAGADGPTLQVMAEGANGRDYADTLEDIWQDWWANPDLIGQLSGPDMLQLWIRSEWVNGEFVAQIVTDPVEKGPVKVKLRAIHPRRLETPPGSVGEVRLGIKRTQAGRPVLYYIDNSPVDQEATGSDYKAVSASNIIHCFKVQEAGQIRGVPWAAPALDRIGDLRNYDDEVLDAARQGNDWSVGLSAEGPDVDPLQVSGSADIERRTMKTLPPGWKPHMLTPPQPHTNYVDYRREVQRDIGRMVHMPLMMVRLDSSNHNFSSARFDGQVYQRANRGIQRWLERTVLNRLVKEVAREARLGGELNEEPDRIKYRWTWPVPPHVDPKKEADAERIRLENGTLTYPEALAAYGLDEDAVIEQRARTNEKLADAGLPPLPNWQDSPTPATNSNADDQETSAERGDRVIDEIVSGEGRAI